MNKEQFLDYLQKPELLNDSSLKELNTLLKDFPYFQTAHLLYLKNLHNLKSIHFTNKLRSTAAYSTDRSTLRKLIVQYHPAEETKTTAKVSEVLEEKVFEQSSILTEQEQNIINTLQKYRKDVDTRSKEKKETKTIFEIQVSPKLENKEVGDIHQLNETQKQTENIEEILNKASDPNNDLIDLVNDKILSEVASTNTIEDSNSLQKDEIAAIPLDGKRSFSDWLSIAKSPNELNNKNSEKKSDEIIKRFMANEPKLERKKAEFYSPTDKAKVSTTLNDALITETLAKIFYKQGNYEKALDSYEKLSLKIPEKKHTFAAQINIIKQKLAEGKTATKKKKSK